jgi:hypothetical protein
VHATPQTIQRSLGLAAAALLGLIWWRGLSPATGAMGALLLIALALSVRRARDPRPLLVIDDTGIADLRLKLGTLAWRDIRRAYACSLKGATFICFEFHEPERYLGRLPWFQRAAGQLWRLFGISPVHVATGHLELPHDELYELVLAHCEASAGRKTSDPVSR